MSDSALLKVKRATKHIRELTNVFIESPPFLYVLETNSVTHQRVIKPKANVFVIDDGLTIIGDAIHNLRAALDHAYFDIASPFAKGERGLKGVQFPFSENAQKFETAAKNRGAHKVSNRFLQVITSLQPYGEEGGNELLYLIHSLDALDKHRLPVPTGEYKTITGAMIGNQISHFPVSQSSVMSFGNNVRGDVVWFTPVQPGEDLGHTIFPTTFMFEKKLNVPVDIVFEVGPNGDLRPVVPTLNAMVSMTKDAIRIIRDAAP